MGRQTHKHNGGWLALSWFVRGKTHVFAPPRWLCYTLVGLLPLVGTWYLAATIYLVFHDQLLASLITRQTDMQYAYEDQIAVLRTQLDRETTRGLVDRHTMETTVQDLRDRGTLLESRAVMLGRLVSHNGEISVVSKGAPPRPGMVNPTASTGALPTAVRAEGPADPAPAAGANPMPRDPAKRADAGDVGAMIDDTTARFARIELAQVAMLTAMRDPMIRSVARLREALVAVGQSGLVAVHDVGGPFVPLSPGFESQDFEQNATLLRDAAAHIARLNGLVAKVPLRKPVDGALEVSSTFGPRIDPFLGRPAMHTGIDFRETYGESVHATAAGTVTIAGTDGGYGTMVEVDHGNGLATRYAHLSGVTVSAGQKIAAGDQVGRVGSTGRATGPHLHYETRINGEPVDPTRFLKVGARLFDD